MTVWLTALIVALSTLAAGTIGAIAALHAGERSRQEARRRDILAALAEYLAAASTVIGELSGLPARLAARAGQIQGRTRSACTHARR